jgi:hypothetical protein
LFVILKISTMSDQNKEQENEKNNAKREGGFGSNPEKSFEEGEKGGLPETEAVTNQSGSSPNSGSSPSMGNASRTEDQPTPGSTDWKDTPAANDNAGVRADKDGPSHNTKSGSSEEKGKGWGEPSGPRGEGHQD